MTQPNPPRRSAEEQARLDAAMIDLFERKIIFNRLLGLRVQQLHPGFEVRFDMRDDLVGHFHYGRLHGGVISSTLDAVGGCSLMLGIADKHPLESADQVMGRFVKIGTIDLRIDYLRQGLGRHFVARSEIMRLGGRIGSTQMRLVNDEGVLIATAAGSYIIA
jgi:uncharacterized protein (TIGR00369 family)